MSSLIPPSAPPTGLEHLSQLNPSVYLSTPKSPPPISQKPSSTSPPTLILLLTWMSAPPRPISKYTNAYNTLYPSSPLLLITTSSLNAIYHTRTSNLRRIAPVLDYLLALPPNARILLHLFSNGGAFSTSLILEEYKQRTGRPLKVELMVFDSAPGRARWRSTVQAFLVGLPASWRKWKVVEGMLSLILAVFFALYKVGYFLSGWILMRKWKGDLVTRTRKALNDKEVVDQKARRLYVYSEGDELVRWRDVEDHAMEAEERSWRVTRERFGRESGHVSHMVVDSKRYWSAVHMAWEGGKTKQRG